VKGPYFTIPRAWAKVSMTDTERAVAWVLWVHMPRCHPGIETIAREAGTSERSARRVLKRFEQRGLIERRRRSVKGRGHATRTSDEYDLDEQAATVTGCTEELAAKTDTKQAASVTSSSVCKRPKQTFASGHRCKGNKHKANEPKIAAAGECPLGDLAPGATQPLADAGREAIRDASRDVDLFANAESSEGQHNAEDWVKRLIAYALKADVPADAARVIQVVQARSDKVGRPLDVSRHGGDGPFGPYLRILRNGSRNGKRRSWDDISEFTQADADAGLGGR